MWHQAFALPPDDVASDIRQALRMGSLVMKLLSERAGFTPVGLVRSAKSAAKVKALLGRAAAPVSFHS